MRVSVSGYGDKLLLLLKQVTDLELLSLYLKLLSLYHWSS